HDIFDHARVEGLIFKSGSGNGTNLSKIREAGAPIGKGGGTASGPLSFEKLYDTVASITKSGGISRRAAKLICLDIDHPDVEMMIKAKSSEEMKAKILGANGYDASPGGSAYDSVFYQNSNVSICLTNAFMEAVE